MGTWTELIQVQHDSEGVALPGSLAGAPPLDVVTHGVEETIEYGRRLGRTLAAGDVLAVCGPLGAGKTHLVKGLAEGLGIADRRAVNSPTFVLVNEYQGRLRLYHLDAYRVPGGAALSAIGFEEMCDAGGVVVIEWADRVREIVPERAVWITIEMVGEMERRIVRGR